MLPIQLHEIPESIIDEVGTVSKLEFPRQGHTSDVGILENEQGRFIIKRTKGEQYNSWLAQEIRVLHSLQKTSLLVPSVYRFVEDKENNQSWALLKFFEGETLRQALVREKNSEKKHETIFNFGAILSAIHATPCPEEMRGESLWLDDMLLRAEYNLRHYNVDGTAELWDSLNRNKPLTITNTLIHGDFTIDNVLVRNGNITGIIDWSGGALGDPRYDVSLAIRPKPNAIETESEIDVFFEGYGRGRISESEYKYFEEGLYAFF